MQQMKVLFDNSFTQLMDLMVPIYAKYYTEEDLDNIDDYLMDDDDDEYDDDYDEDDDYEDADEDDDQDEYDFGSETLYEVKCPTCGEVITIDEEMLDEGATTCPNCGEELEFDMEDEEPEEDQ